MGWPAVALGAVDGLGAPGWMRLPLLRHAGWSHPGAGLVAESGWYWNWYDSEIELAVAGDRVPDNCVSSCGSQGDGGSEDVEVDGGAAAFVVEPVGSLDLGEAALAEVDEITAEGELHVFQAGDGRVWFGV